MRKRIFSEGIDACQTNQMTFGWKKRCNDT